MGATATSAFGIALLAVLTYLLIIALFFILSIALTDFKGFKRAEIKKRAWDSLRCGKYWLAFGVTAVFSLISGGIGGLGSTSFNYNSGNTDSGINYTYNTTFEEISPYVGVVAGVVILVFIFAFVFSLCFSVFISNILTVGLNRFFILNLFGRPEFKELFYGFTNGNYVKILKVMFKKTLYTFLWTLLFIIPGIIKSFEYYMVPYILAENPDIDEDTAFRLSKEMMDGNKWRTFVLSISFIGWEILCIFTLGFGYYFLFPYMFATYATLYEKLRMNISEEEREMFLNNEMFGFKKVEEIEVSEINTEEAETNEEADESVDEIPEEKVEDSPSEVNF